MQPTALGASPCEHRLRCESMTNSASQFSLHRKHSVFLIASMMVCPRFSEFAFGDYWSGPGGTSGRKSAVFLRDRIAKIVRSIFGSAWLEYFVRMHIVGIEWDLGVCKPLAMCHVLQG